MDQDRQNCTLKLRSLREMINWKIEAYRYALLDLLFALLRNWIDWKGPLPNLRDIFSAKEIDRLLMDSMINCISRRWDYYKAELIIDFVARAGYKDEPESHENGTPSMRRITALHYCIESEKCHPELVANLFKIFNRFDANYVDVSSGLTHFHVACEFELLDIVEKFLKSGQDPNCPARECEPMNSFSPLQLAVDFKNSELVELLLRSGASPNLVHGDGSTSVHSVGFSGDEKLSKFFFEICDDLKLKVEIDARNKWGYTPLHYALIDFSSQVVELLLRRGADINVACNNGRTPLHHLPYFTNNCNDDFIERFFEIWDKQQQTGRIDAQDSNGYTPLFTAVTFANKKVIEKLLRRGANANLAKNNGRTPLHFICQCTDNDCELAKMFFDICEELRTKVLYNAQDHLGNTALFLAAECGNKKAIEKLLRKGADPNLANNNGWNPLHCICQHLEHDNLEIFFKILDDLKLTVEVNAQTKSGRTPLYVALECGNSKAVKWLLTRGADPNLPDAEGLTPLHIIARYVAEDDDDSAEIFWKICDNLKHTVTVDAQDKADRTPLHEALAGDNIEVAKVLLRRGADPNITDSDGCVPLHIICSRENEDYGLAEMFFNICDDEDRQVKIDAVDDCGNTPLHKALISNNQQVVGLLLRRGANPNLINKEGQTPLHIICKRASSQDNLLQMVPRLAQLDVMDPLGRTPLQWAVENLVPRVVNILLDHGADRSSFAFPTASDFDQRFDSRFFSSIYTNFKLRMASSLLLIAENLEKRGYQFDYTDTLTIMRFFAKHDLFEESSDLDQPWYDEEFTSEAKKVMINSSLSLYDLIQLRPEDEEKLLKYEDYFKFAEFDDASIVPEGVREACHKHLCEMMSRGFFRRWALDPFWKLIHRRLPIECSEMVLSNLMNEDLCHICLAAVGQSL